MRSVTSTEQSIARALTLANAVEAGDAARVSALLAAGAHADEPLRGGETPLMRAAARGYEDIARALLDAGADANAQRADGFTPLVLAVFFGHERVVCLLLTYGADATAETRLGTTAAHWADARGFAEIARLLRGAMPTRADAKKSEERSARAVGAKVVGAKSVDAALKDSGAYELKDANELKDSDAVEKSVGTSGPLTVSVRHEGQTPAHPSAKAFRLGGFLRSWQGSVGTALLLTAIGVAVFAVWRNRPPRENTQPMQAAQPLAPPTLAQPVAPAASAPVAQPSPILSPTPVMPVAGVPPDATYYAPNPSAQPYYVPPAAPNPLGASSVPVVVSESDAPTAGETSRPKRKDAAATNDAASSTPTDAGREASSADDNSRPAASVRNARTQDSEAQQPAPPAKSSSAPAPTPTPEHRKVIQWPPQ